MSEFLYMDGYGAYVWSSYAVVAATLIANVIFPLRRHRRLKRELAARRRA